ncbi:hypothetical protein [Streptomyces niveus]|uniref:hypothetical protein n=1 Tax=Streptomyces niveus TaxID=193462 RepID=UPI0035D53D72
MSEGQKVYEYETEGGKLYIRILSAELKTYGSGWNGKPVSEELRPRVEIATDSEFQAHVNKGFVMLRGRKYAIGDTVRRLPEGEGRLDDHGFTKGWYREPAYFAGFRNGVGAKVNRETKAYGALRELEFEALNRFEEDHPDWQAESIRILFEFRRDFQRDKAKEARAKAAKAIREADEWQARIDQLGGAA